MKDFNPFVIGVVNGAGPTELRPLSLESMAAHTVSMNGASVFDTVPAVSPEIAAHCAAVVDEEEAEIEATSLAFDLAAVAHHVHGTPFVPVARIYPGITINSDHLRQAVARVVGTVSKRDTLPILHHVLIEGATTGDRLTLTTTNLDTATRATIPASGCVADFAACVPAATLSDWLARVPKGAALTLDTPKAGEIAGAHGVYGAGPSVSAIMSALSYTKANGCKSRLELVALPSDDFPIIPSVTAGRLVECNAAAIGLALSAVLPYAMKESQSYGREFMSGVYMSAGLNGLTFTGCDTHRMKVETVAAFMPVGELTAGAGESITAILPAAVCKALVGACKAAGPDAALALRVESDSEGADKVSVELNGVEIFARVMSGALYPEATAKIAADFAPVLTFEVDRATFVKQLQAMGGKFNAAGVVEFEFTRGGDCLELHGYGVDGARSVEEVALIKASGATSCEVFGVSAKLLLQALPVVRGAKKPVAVAPLLIEVAANAETGVIDSIRFDGTIIMCHKTRAQLAAEREAAAEIEAAEVAATEEPAAKVFTFDVATAAALHAASVKLSGAMYGAAAAVGRLGVTSPAVSESVEFEGAGQAAARILEAENLPIPTTAPQSLDAAQIGAVERVAAYVAELKARHSDRATKLEKSFAWQVGEISNVLEYHANKGRDAWRALEIWERGAMAAAQKKVAA